MNDREKIWATNICQQSKQILQLAQQNYDDIESFFSYQLAKEAPVVCNNLNCAYLESDKWIIRYYAETPNNEIPVDRGIIKEEEEMPVQLKYGKGSISKIIRATKKGQYKYYLGRYMDNGTQKSVTGKTQEACFQRLKEAQIHLIPKKKAAKNSKNSLASWVEEWFLTYKKHKIKESTATGYFKVINDLKQCELGKISINLLTAPILQKYLMAIARDNTRDKCFDVINAALNKAVALDMIFKNPMINVEIPTVKSKHRRAFTFAEQNLMLNSLTIRYAAVFRFLCCTGLRVGEFIALQDNSIDWNKHLIWVTESKAANSAEITTPKTKSSVRPVQFLTELFNDIKLGTYTYDGIKKAFNTAMIKNNITGVSIHCTRHTFSSLCYYYNIQDKYIQTWLGHSTIAMTMDTYTHIMDEGTSKIGEYIKALKVKSSTNSYTN